jgi:integrase
VKLPHLKTIIEEIRGKGLAPNTAMNAMRTLSTFYTDLIEEGRAVMNPVRLLPRKTRKKYLKRLAKDEPFMEELMQVATIIQHLSGVRRDVATAYAIGALAGLRTGEVIGLEWDDVDLARMVIHVRRQVRHGKVGPLKDGDEREVGVQASLLPLLKIYKAYTGGKGRVFPPTAAGRGGTKKTPSRYLAGRTLDKHLGEALAHLKLKDLTWYQATRHTFASHYMMAGGNISKLQSELGHSDVQTTQRYAKLAPNFRTDADRQLLTLPVVTGAIDVKLMETTKTEKRKRRPSTQMN